MDEIDDEIKGPDESQFQRAAPVLQEGEEPPEDLKGPGEEWDRPEARAEALPATEEA